MDWSTWKQATCIDCWCEAARIGSFVLEPVNAWTNVTFVSAGLFFFFRSRAFINGSNVLTSDELFPRLYGFAAVFVGAGSFFYHASQTFAGQWFDVFGMYLVSMFFVAYNFLRIGLFNRRSFLVFYFLSCLLLGLIIFYLPDTRRYLFGSSIALVVVQSVWIQLSRKSVIDKRYLIGALLAYGVAQTLWVLDKNRIWCDPHAYMNGHGLWHILTCLAAILGYLYFASEKQRLTTA